MRPGYQIWTERENELLFELREDEAMSWSEIAKHIGRAAESCKKQYYTICMRRRAARGEAFDKVPNAAMIDRERRETARARASITAQVFGDPPPGYSALDRRRRASA